MFEGPAKNPNLNIIYLCLTTLFIDLLKYKIKKHKNDGKQLQILLIFNYITIIILSFFFNC